MWSFALEFQRRNMDIERFLNVCRDLQVDCVELVDHFWIPVGQPLHLLTDCGLCVCAYDIASDFVHLAPASRHQQLELAYASVEEAMRIGAEMVRLLPGRMKEGIADEDALQMVVEAVSSVARYAHKAGIRVVLEPHGDVVNSAETLRYVHQQVHSSAFGVSADLCTFLLSGLDPVRECAAIADICALVHLNNLRRVHRGYPGYLYYSTTGETYAGTGVCDGEIDIRRCIEALVAGGFRGISSVECLSMSETLSGVRQSLDDVRAILQEVRDRE